MRLELLPRPAADYELTAETGGAGAAHRAVRVTSSGRAVRRPGARSAAREHTPTAHQHQQQQSGRRTRTPSPAPAPAPALGPAVGREGRRAATLSLFKPTGAAAAAAAARDPGSEAAGAAAVLREFFEVSHPEPGMLGGQALGQHKLPPPAPVQSSNSDNSAYSGGGPTPAYAGGPAGPHAAVMAAMGGESWRMHGLGLPCLFCQRAGLRLAVCCARR